MKIKDIIVPLEEFAPTALQEPYDNAGLTVGRPDDEVEAALICVDATQEVLDEAERLGARLVISHHPIIFHPLKRLNGKSRVEKVVERAIRSGIALYACHTNLDRARHGMSWVLAQKLGLQEIEIFNPEGEAEEARAHPSVKAGGNEKEEFSSCRGLKPPAPYGFGAIGDLPVPVAALDFLRTVRSKLGIGCIRHTAPCRETVKRIAMIAGAGGEGIEKAIEDGADVFLTADVRYDRFLAAEKEILMADIGHFESEFCAIDLMFDVISKKITNFALHKSQSSRNPVNYLVENGKYFNS